MDSADEHSQNLASVNDQHILYSTMTTSTEYNLSYSEQSAMPNEHFFEVNNSSQPSIYMDISNTRSNESYPNQSLPGCSKDVIETHEEPSLTINNNVSELKTLLCSWHQEELLDYFIAEKIFINVLKVIKRHHIERVMKNLDLGTQILFENNLDEWRQSIGFPLMCETNSQQYFFNPSSPPANILSPSTSSIRAESTISNPYSRCSSPGEGINITLAMFLNQNPKGQMLAEYYKNYSKFNEEQRICLINSLAQFFEEKDVSMTLGCSFRLEKEILERFPSEKLEYYRTQKRGKLYNKYCNMKKIFKAVTQNSTNAKKAVVKKMFSRLDNDIVAETDAESCLRSLKFDNLTAEQFDNCWKACSKYRLIDIKNNTNLADLFKKWPMYTTPNGFRLIDMDFNTGFETGNGLLENWEPSINKIMSFLKSNNNIKDKTIKGLLANLDDSYSDNGRDATVMFCLHGYFVPTDKIYKKDKDGKKSLLKFTIKDSQESFLFLGRNIQEVEDYLSFLKQKQESIQPFIICIGESIAEIKEIYLYFDDIKYKFFNFLRAVDLCFKTFFVFNLNFPPQAHMFWNFIETYFYKRPGEKSYSKVHVLCEFLV